MENFFVEDKFYADIEELMSDHDLEEEDLPGLPDDWAVKCMSTNLEPICALKYGDVIEAIVEYMFRYHEERMPEEYDDCSTKKRLEAAITSSVDVGKLNDLMPKLYYPGGEDFTITKQDLIACFLPTQPPLLNGIRNN